MNFVKISLEYAESIRQLGDAEAGRLLRAIVVYATTGEELTLSGNERILWGLIRKDIDKQRRSYDGKCESMAAAREQNPNNNKALREQPEDRQITDSSLSDSRQFAIDNSQETEKKREKEAGEKREKERSKEKERKDPEERAEKPPKAPPAPPPNREPMVTELLAETGEPLRMAVDEWLRYKREKRETYKPIGLKMLLNKIVRYATECGEQAVTTAIYDAMSSNYQGIVWDRLVKKPQQPQQPRQQNGGMQAKYDMMDRWRNGRK